MPQSEDKARQIWVTDAEGREWYGSLTPLQGEAQYTFTLTCREVKTGVDIDRLFPDGGDLEVNTAPHHRAILHGILLTFRSRFPGMRDRRQLPHEVRGICERVTDTTVDFLPSADQIKAVSFALPEALSITATPMHKCDQEAWTTSTLPSHQRILPFGAGRLLTLEFGCAINSSTADRQTTYTDVCSAHITFDPPVTAETALDDCQDLRLLMHLLDGTPRMSRPATLVAANGERGETCLSPLAPIERQHRNVVAPLWSESESQWRLEHLIERYLSQRDKLRPAIAAALFCLFHSSNLETRLLVTIPTLEALARQDFNSAEEVDFMDRKEEFWAWVDQKSHLGEFGRKHLKESQSKAPSLKMVFDRLADHLSERGAKFPPNIGAALARLRGRRFHSSDTGDRSGIEVYNNQIAATAMLTFRALDLLGIRPDDPGFARWRISELRPFYADRLLNKKAPHSGGA